MAITYNAGTNVITVTGYTEGTPCNFTDIYNADVAGSWGVVTRQCTSQFCFDCKLIIGDSSTATWVADETCAITFTTATITASGQYTIDVKNNAVFRLGKLISDANKITELGCFLKDTVTAYNHYFINTESSSAKVYIYDCILSGVRAPSYVSAIVIKEGKLYNTLLNGIYMFLCDNITVDRINSTKAERYANFGSAGTWNDLKIVNAEKALGFGNYAAQHPKNVILRSNTYSLFGYNMTVDCSVTNIDSDNYNCWWFSSTAKLYRKYELDLKVIDKDNVAINGATVKIWDKDSTLVVDTTTNASGVISTQTISRGYYNSANGSTLQEASPHLIKIEKADYTTYEADFTLGDKTDWLIALQAAGGGLMRNPPMTGGMV